MTSTDMNIGVASNNRPSSRVLKPPGGGHTNFFAEPEVAVNAPRPKHNQQNSSNINACMGSTDPNLKVEKLREEIQHTTDKAEEPTKAATTANNGNNGNGNAASGNARTGRVPPGGFSSGGFW